MAGKRARRRARHEEAIARREAHEYRRAHPPRRRDKRLHFDEHDPRRQEYERERRLSSNYARMAYIAPIHRASNFRLAIKTHFLDAEEENVAVAKANRLEIYAQTAQGLVLKYSKAVYGQIIILQKLRPASSATDHLFLCTERHVFFTVSWDASRAQLKTEKSFVDLSERTSRDMVTNDRCFVDPRGRFITLALLEGVYNVCPVYWKPTVRNKVQADLGSLAEEVLPVRIGEIRIRSSTYLHYRTPSDKEHARIATLYQDNQDNVWLKVRTLMTSRTLDTANFQDEKILLRNKLEPNATHLIAVPNPINGVLVVAETCITWVNDDTEHEPYMLQPLDEATIWDTWTQIDDFRWLLADEFGYLYLLMLERAHNAQHLPSIKIDKLGRTSRAACLLYLDEGRVLVGSHWGDSQVVQITASDDSGPGFEVVQTFANIGPIVDFTVMDMGSRAGGNQANEYSSGQARLVTGSGAFADGSLRSIRSGVGIEEIGSLELDPDGISKSRPASDMFHLPLHVGEVREDLLLVSYVNETRIFRFAQDGSVEEIQQMVTEEPTILAERLQGNQSRIIQCTNRRVSVYALTETGLGLLAQWSVEGVNNVVAASTSDSHLVLSIGGSHLVALDISEAGTAGGKLTEVAHRQVEEMISCIDVPKQFPQCVLVGFWQSTSLSVLSLPTLEPSLSFPISDKPSAVPRSLLLTQILPDHPPTLFLSLADGHIVTYDVNRDNFALSNRQTTLLGSQSANLKILPRNDNLSSIFAIAEHSTMIYGSENRLVFAAVTAEDATCICPFDAGAYPEAVALATPTELKIAMVERERTTHIQTLHVGETVRRIAYSPELHAFGLGTIRRTLSEGTELVQSYFKLADEIAFEVLSAYPMREEEIIESVCRLHVMEGGKERERFAVGTTYLPPEDDSEQPRGRLMIFEVTEDRQLKLVTETKLKGACRALATIKGKIVAALVKTVVVYDYNPNGLQKKAAYRCATAPIDIFVDGDKIVVSDLMKSVAVIQHKSGANGEPDKLEEVARHHSLCWSTAIAPVGEKLVLESDAERNLILLSPSDEWSKTYKLESVSEIHLGEMVNRIRPIRVPSSSDAMIEPRAFLVTVNGGIFMLGIPSQPYVNELLTLQATLAKHVQSPGNIPWNTYRALKNSVKDETEPLRFLDSDLLEAFLDCDETLQQAIHDEYKKALGASTFLKWDTVSKLRAMVETLRRMH